jgi:RHS repeat-associated protein
MHPAALRSRRLGFALLLALLALAAGGLLQPQWRAHAQAAGAATITNPVSGSTLSGATVTFAWTAGNAASQYWLFLGPSQGASDLLTLNQGTARSYTASGLPTKGKPLWARLWSLVGSTWEYADSSFTANAGGASQPAILTSPTPGSTFAGSSVTFAWTTGTGVTQYMVYAGSTPGGVNYANKNVGSATSTTITTMPTDGSPIYVRLYSFINSNWQGYDYLFTTATGGSNPGMPTLTSPASGAANLTTQPTLTWTAPAGAVTGTTQYTVHWIISTTNPPATWGSSLPPTTNTMVQLPSGIIGAGNQLEWMVIACNGGTCSNWPQSVLWSTLTAGQTSHRQAPGAVSQSAPGDNAANAGTTPTLSWSKPAGATSGSTQYIVHLRSGAAGAGTELVPLPATTNLSTSVPSQWNLAANQTFSWNVVACDGLTCSPLNPSWFTFSTGAGSGGTGAPGVVTQSSPADRAINTGVTPTLTWSAPSGAVSGSTTYSVSLWDPAANTMLASVNAGTALSVAVPSGEGLTLGKAYHWDVTACKGSACSTLNPHWFDFSTAPAPGTPTLMLPANNSSGQSVTPHLTFSVASGFYLNVTTFTVSIWDPYGAPSGHKLADIPAGLAGSGGAGTLDVPASEGLYYGQSYQWNVTACNGDACSSYAPSWFTFTTMVQPAATASGAAQTAVVNGDFAGASGTTVPGWTGTVTSAAYLDVVNPPALTSKAFTLNYPTNGKSWFRLGYRLQSGSLTVGFTSGGTTNTVFSQSTTGSAWQESTFAIPSSAGGTGQLVLTGGEVAYVERLDGPAAMTGPKLGAASNPRIAKGVGAVDGGGVDLTTGGFGYAHTDLALPGVMGIAFTRGYANQATPVQMTSSGPFSGPLGPKWTSNWSYQLIQLDATDVMLRLPGGSSYTFMLVGGAWVAPVGVNAALLDAPQNPRWTLVTGDQVTYGFDLSGRLLSITDRNGNATTLTYDSGGNLTQITDPAGRYIQVSYASHVANATITGLTDSAGRSVSYGYDGSTGDLTSVTDVLTGVTRYGYSGHWLSQLTDPLTNVVLRNTYDSPAQAQGIGLVTVQTDAANNTESFAYAFPAAGETQVTDQRGKKHTAYFDWGLRVTDVLDAYNNRLSSTYDADNNTMSTASGQYGGLSAETFDGWGNVLTATDAWNFTTSFTYDAFNNVLTVTDPQGHVTINTYDAKGNLQSTKDALNNTTSVTVNSLGQVTQITDPRNNSVSYGYSTAGDRTTVTDALNHSSTTGYDNAGRPTSVTDPLTHVSSATYDAANHVLTATNALNQTTTFTYDADERLKTVQDANLKTTTNNYDARGLLTSVIDPQNGSGAPTSYAYDSAGNRITVTDAKNQATHYTFDDDERMSTVADPLGNVLDTNTYDALGRVATHKDAKNQTTTYAYTLRSQVSSVTYADSSTVMYQYDALGNRTQMVDPTGTTTYSYDALNRPTSITFPGSKTVGYGYDAAGNRSSITYPGGTRQVTYSYDQDERLASVTDWNSQQTSYSYDAASRLTQTTLPASTGVTSAYSYNNANRLLSVTHSKGGSTIASASYTLDAVGNRSQKTTAAGNETYTYDNLYRLTNVTYPDSTSTGYSYDPVGNRLTMSTAAGTTNYGYDASDRLTSVTPPGSGAQTNTYDVNGSETARNTDSFTWDAKDRLSAATIGGQSFSASYNGDGLRSSRTAGGTTTNFVWDMAAKLPVVLDDGTQYVYGSGLVSQVTSSGTFFLLADGLGSTVAVVDGSGNTVNTYTYDAFGAVKSSTGTQSTEYGFAAQETDASGLQYLRARYYDPTAGHFLSRDPDRASRNDPASRHPYTYAMNQPTVAYDPSGLDTIYLIAAGPNGALVPIDYSYPGTVDMQIGLASYGPNGPMGGLAAVLNPYSPSWVGHWTPKLNSTTGGSNDPHKYSWQSLPADQDSDCPCIKLEGSIWPDNIRGKWLSKWEVLQILAALGGTDVGPAASWQKTLQETIIGGTAIGTCVIGTAGACAVAVLGGTVWIWQTGNPFINNPFDQ